MTALQLARAECANFKNDVCLGMNIETDLRLTRMKGEGRPCILSAGERCRYFEECVLPMAEYVNDAKKAKTYSGVAFDYRRAHPEMGLAATRRCPECGKNAIGGGDRYCPECREQRRKMSNQKSQERVRTRKSGGVSAVAAKPSVDSQRVTEAVLGNP
jgi:hypothetical protein